MKRVRQEHRTSCGIACVATITGVAYDHAMETARRLFGWAEDKRTFYTSAWQLQTLLGEFGIHSDDGHRVDCWTQLPDIAILGINHNDRTNTWHWVVYRRHEEQSWVLDPQSRRDLRRDFGRMRLRSCIPVRLAPPAG